MDSEFEEFERACEALSRHKKTSTGEPLFVPARSDWPSTVQDESDFSALVSSVYKVWRESWRLDVGFLLGTVGNSNAARDFGQLIYDLRTAEQHTGNVEEMDRRAGWLEEVCGGRSPESDKDWAACGCALVIALNAAVVFLTTLAAGSRTRRGFREAWQAKFSESVQAVVTQVADDLNLRLPTSSRQHHEREVEKRWSKYKLRSGETAAQVIASFAEGSLISNIRRLPCDYVDILDELHVLGTNDAAPALRLAHSVAEISLATGDTYVKLVATTWLALRSGTIS